MIKLPKTFMGKPIKGSIERVLEQSGTDNKSNSSTDAGNVVDPNAGKVPNPVGNPPAPATSVNNPQGYIILPAATHGSYSYPDTLIAMNRTYTDISWYDAHKALADEGSYMPTIRQFVDFLNILKSGNAFDDTGNPVQKTKLDDILADILENDYLSRGEWLDAKFQNLGGVMGIGSKMHILYEHRFVNGKLEPRQVKKINPDITNRGYNRHIDLEFWLNNADDYGLPPINVSSGDLLYFPPTSSRVASFSTNSIRSVFDCHKYRNVPDALEVRACRTM